MFSQAHKSVSGILYTGVGGGACMGRLGMHDGGGACIVGVMHGGGVHGRVACVAGRCMAGGHAWQRGDVCGEGGVHDRRCAWWWCGACMAGGGIHGRRHSHCSRWYTFYWNAFLFDKLKNMIFPGTFCQFERDFSSFPLNRAFWHRCQNCIREKKSTKNLPLAGLEPLTLGLTVLLTSCLSYLTPVLDPIA